MELRRRLFVRNATRNAKALRKFFARAAFCSIQFPDFPNEVYSTFLASGQPQADHDSPRRYNLEP
jgi:hypothetical protein